MTQPTEPPGPDAAPDQDPSPTATNLAWWDERAGLHGQDRYYDVEGFVTDDARVTLKPHEIELLGDLHGKSVVHMQCHTGMDTLSMVRLGADSVTGLDFSAVALQQAEATAERAGILDADFLRCDILDPPHDLFSQYDVAFANTGAICWIGDLDRWMTVAHNLLKPGGRLAIYEIHPLYNMTETLDPLVLDYPYQDDGPQRYDDDSGSYAVPDAETENNSTVTWAHSLGEIINATVAAGFQVRRLDEHLAVTSDGRGLLPRESDGLHRWRTNSGHLLPIWFSLLASKPAA